MRIDWERVWNDFAEWYDALFDPEWDKQQEKIQQLVNNQLRSKK